MRATLHPRTRPTIPWGLLGMVAFVAFSERLVFHGNPSYSTLQSESWRYKGQAISQARECEILCFGDSLSHFGVLPKVIEKQTGRTAYNLAVHHAAAPATYFLLRRTLDAGARPSAILVDFSPGQLQIGPSSTTSPYPWADLLRLEEGVELAWAARDPDLLAWLLAARLLASVRGRHEVRAIIRSVLEGKGTGRREYIAALRRNWEDNAGAQVIGRAAAHPQKVPRMGRRLPQIHWQSHPVNALYVRKFLDLAARHDLAVFWLLPPFRPGFQAFREQTGEDGAFARFSRALLARYPNLTVIDGRHSGYERDVFTDPVHLDRVGAIAFSSGLGGLLRRQRDGALNESRWIALPLFDGRPIDVAVVDLAPPSFTPPPPTVRPLDAPLVDLARSSFALNPPIVLRR